MGCCEGANVRDGVPKKPFHELSEEEQKKILEELKEQDKNLVREDDEQDEDPKLYEMYNWEELMAKLPIKKTEEDRKKRLELWNQINEYGNGYVSFKRLDFQLEKYLKLPKVVRNKGPLKLAFDAASDKYERYGLKKEDNLIEWMEFRIFLVYLRQYFEYWVMFEKMDITGDHRINLKEFKLAIPLMGNWGVKIKDSEAEKVFKSIDKTNGGAISFEEFCSYAITKSLDLEEDDNFDDEELKNLK